MARIHAPTQLGCALELDPEPGWHGLGRPYVPSGEFRYRGLPDDGDAEQDRRRSVSYGPTCIPFLRRKAAQATFSEEARYNWAHINSLAAKAN